MDKKDLMVKEIYRVTDNSDFLNIRVITRKELNKAIDECLVDGWHDPPITRENLKVFYDNETVVLDEYGEPWEEAFMEALDYYAESIDSLRFSSFEEGISVSYKFEHYSEFCRDHMGDGNILIIG